MIGYRVKLARKVAGLSKRELSEKTGISVYMISKLEGDKKMPSSSQLISLSKALGQRVEFFVRPKTFDFLDVKLLVCGGEEIDG